LQDFGSQSSQIGPHLVQPFSRRPMAITLKTTASRRNIVHHSHRAQLYRLKSGIFKPHRTRLN